MAKNPALNPESVTIYHLMAAESSQIGWLFIVCIACVRKCHTLSRKTYIIKYQ